MKYKVLKPFLGTGLSSEIHRLYDNPNFKSSQGLEIPFEELVRQGFIEEVKETPKPKFKVGDYVVREYQDSLPPDYMKIHTVGIYSPNGTTFTYNNDSDFKESDLRSPTESELSLYFR